MSRPANALIADLFKMLYQCPQAIAMCGDEYSLTFSNGRNRFAPKVFSFTPGFSPVVEATI
jgi:hypothetical protein